MRLSHTIVTAYATDFTVQFPLTISIACLGYDIKKDSQADSGLTETSLHFSGNE